MKQEEPKMPVLIFDEIDTGISGKAANSVAQKLSIISKMHQVICISHLPNIAAMADYNYFLSKKVLGKRTNTSIKLLTEEEYKYLQTLGDFDLKSSSWLLTKNEIRLLGGAIFGDKRYNRTFIYHNGAESYYSNRGFRAILKI